MPAATRFPHRRFFLFAAGLLAGACGKNTSPMEGPAPTVVPGGAAPSPVAAPPHGRMPPGDPGGAMPANPWSVSGRVDLAPQFAGKVAQTDVLFVMAREPGKRMPVSVERFPAPRFPLEYTLHSGHGESTAAPPAMEVVARLSRGGTAGPPQPGDLEGTYAGTATAGATGVNVVLDVQY